MPDLTELEPQTALLRSLREHLDELWITYLQLLDAYQAAQKHIQQSSSRGFLSLAQANFASTRRFGRDHFDERAVAGTRVQIDETSKLTPLPQLRVVAWSAKGLDEAEQGAPVDVMLGQAAVDRISDKASLPTPAASPEPTTFSESPAPEAFKAKDKASDKEGTTPSAALTAQDPLRWFGILVPRALRDAQQAFCDAVSDTEHGITGAVNAMRALRDVEVEIRRTRKLVARLEKRADADPGL